MCLWPIVWWSLFALRCHLANSSNSAVNCSCPLESWKWTSATRCSGSSVGYSSNSWHSLRTHYLAWSTSDCWGSVDGSSAASSSCQWRLEAAHCWCSSGSSSRCSCSAFSKRGTGHSSSWSVLTPGVTCCGIENRRYCPGTLIEWSFELLDGCCRFRCTWYLCRYSCSPQLWPSVRYSFRCWSISLADPCCWAKSCFGDSSDRLGQCKHWCFEQCWPSDSPWCCFRCFEWWLTGCARPQFCAECCECWCCCSAWWWTCLALVSGSGPPSFHFENASLKSFSAGFGCNSFAA